MTQKCGVRYDLTSNAGVRTYLGGTVRARQLYEFDGSPRLGCVQRRLLKLPLHNLSQILHETINISNAELGMDTLLLLCSQPILTNLTSKK